METLVPSKLTDEQIAERGMIIARKRVEVNALKRRRKAATNEIDGQIKTLEAEIDKYSLEMVDGQEMLRQGDIFAKPANAGPGPEAPTPNQAAEALTDIARAAGDAPKPLPSEPHLFHAVAGSDVCSICGSAAGDPIHGAEAVAAVGAQATAEAFAPETPAVACSCNPDAEPPTFCDDHMPLSMRRMRERRKALEAAEEESKAKEGGNGHAGPDPFEFEGDEPARTIVGGGSRPAAGFTPKGDA